MLIMHTQARAFSKCLQQHLGGLFIYYVRRKGGREGNFPSISCVHLLFSDAFSIVLRRTQRVKNIENFAYVIYERSLGGTQNFRHPGQVLIKRQIHAFFYKKQNYKKHSTMLLETLKNI